MPNGSGERQLERDLRIARARRAKALRRAVWVAAMLLVLGGVAWVLVRYAGRQASGGPGVSYPSQGQQHVALGTPFAYSSNPPTSGPHFATPAEWGVYGEEVPDQVLIHNLEHGGIWIAYRPGVASSTVEELEAIGREFGRKVIIAPRAANDADIALAAWGRLDKFSAAEFSEERVRAFIKAWRNKGPEFVP